MTAGKDLPTTTIRHIEIISASPEQIYDALTDAAIHARFTGEPATSDARVGGKMTAHDGYIEGQYLELERPSRIVQTWRTTSWMDGYEDSRLEIQLEPSEDGTQLTMLHTLVPAGMAPDFDSGWKEHYWEPLKTHFRDS